MEPSSEDSSLLDTFVRNRYWISMTSSHYVAASQEGAYALKTETRTHHRKHSERSYTAASKCHVTM